MLLASSTAFFATFSIAPIFVIIIRLFSALLGEEVIKEEILFNMRTWLGKQAELAVHSALENMAVISDEWYLTLLGFAFMIFIASSLWATIKVAINHIWGVRPKSHLDYRAMIKDRFIGIFLIMIFGALILVNILSHLMLAYIRESTVSFTGDYNLVFAEFAGEIVSFVMMILWFALIYRILPAAKVEWKVVWIGSMVTGLLFAVGRFSLIKLLPSAGLATIYGTSGAYMLILLFVFYSALTFYLGAAFTRKYAEFAGYQIQPKANAVRVHTREIFEE